MNKFKNLSLLTLLFIPFVAHAATLQTIIDKAKLYLGDFITILMSIAFIYFILTIIKLIRATGDDRDDIKKQVMWAVIALFILVSIWGIVGFMGETLDVKPGGVYSVPQLPG